MPSRLHEMLVGMFCKRPEVTAELLSRSLKMEVPSWQQVRVESSDFTDRKPAAHQADAAVSFWVGDKAVAAAVVEVQLRPDKGKHYSWPVYLATLRERARCPTVLLVVCTNARTAAWAAKPIDLGHPGLRLAPLVIGPGKVPIVTDPEQARRAPELAVFSAIAHPTHPHHEQILRAMLVGVQGLDRENADVYTEVALLALPEAARQSLERLMDLATFEPQSEYFLRKANKLAEKLAEERAQKLVEERTAETEARAVLTVLDARGVEVPDDVRTRVTECTDLGQLEAWVRRAATASSVDDLFDK